MLFGVGIAYESVFGAETTNPVMRNLMASIGEEAEFLEGHPVRINATGHLIPVPHMTNYDDMEGHLPMDHDLPVPKASANDRAKHKAILFMAFICVCE